MIGQAVGLPYLEPGQAVDCMVLPGLFEVAGPIKSEDLKDARTICRKCPAVQTCGEWAVRHEEYGIWAGTTPTERSRIRTLAGIELEDPYLGLTKLVTPSRTPVKGS